MTTKKFETPAYIIEVIAEHNGEELTRSTKITKKQFDDPKIVPSLIRIMREISNTPTDNNNWMPTLYIEDGHYLHYDVFRYMYPDVNIENCERVVREFFPNKGEVTHIKSIEIFKIKSILHDIY